MINNPEFVVSKYLTNLCIKFLHQYSFSKQLWHPILVHGITRIILTLRSSTEHNRTSGVMVVYCTFLSVDSQWLMKNWVPGSPRVTESEYLTVPWLVLTRLSWCKGSLYSNHKVDCSLALWSIHSFPIIDVILPFIFRTLGVLSV